MQLVGPNNFLSSRVILPAVEVFLRVELIAPRASSSRWTCQGHELPWRQRVPSSPRLLKAPSNRPLKDQF